MAINKIEIQNSMGDIYYPHTSSDVVKHNNTTVSATLQTINNKFNNYLLKNENSASATKLQTARTITLQGAVVGSASFDGSKNITITTTGTGGGGGGTGGVSGDGLTFDSVYGTLTKSIYPATGKNIFLGNADNPFHTLATKVIDMHDGYSINRISSLGSYLDSLEIHIPKKSSSGTAYSPAILKFYSIGVNDRCVFGPNTTSSGGDTHRAEFSLGASSSKWHSVWSAMGSIQTSDINCKENIKNVVAEEKVKKDTRSSGNYSDLSSDAVVDVVKSLNPITFDYKGKEKVTKNGDDYQASTQLGVSAQELEQLNPTLFKYVGVKTMDTKEDGSISIDYSIKTFAYTNMLLVALQETMKKVEELEKKIEKLKQG